MTVIIKFSGYVDENVENLKIYIDSGNVKMVQVGGSLVVLWLGFSALITAAWVPLPDRELPLPPHPPKNGAGILEMGSSSKG